MLSSRYNDSIFINCPFDIQYSPILRAVLYTIYRCGFYPKCTLAEDNGLNWRLDKIENCIQRLGLDMNDIPFTEYCQIIEEAIERFLNKLAHPASFPITLS